MTPEAVTQMQNLAEALTIANRMTCYIEDEADYRLSASDAALLRAIHHHLLDAQTCADTLIIAHDAQCKQYDEQATAFATASQSPTDNATSPTPAEEPADE